MLKLSHNLETLQLCYKSLMVKKVSHEYLYFLSIYIWQINLHCYSLIFHSLCNDESERSLLPLSVNGIFADYKSFDAMVQHKTKTSK